MCIQFRERYLRHIYRGLSCVLFWFLCAAWRVIVDRTTSDIYKQQFCCRRRWWGVFSFGNFFLYFGLVGVFNFRVFLFVFCNDVNVRNVKTTRELVCVGPMMWCARRAVIFHLNICQTLDAAAHLVDWDFTFSRHSHQVFWEVFTLLAIDDHSRLTIQIRNEFNKLLHIFFYHHHLRFIFSEPRWRDFSNVSTKEFTSIESGTTTSDAICDREMCICILANRQFSQSTC